MAGFAMRWWVVLWLLGACHRTEYIDVPRAGGGTVRVVKAREPLMKKLDLVRPAFSAPP
jgi:hypothetical protein